MAKITQAERILRVEIEMKDVKQKIVDLDKKVEAYLLESKNFHAELLNKIDKDLVSQKEFEPIRAIVYGTIKIILTAIVLAGLGLIIAVKVG